MASRRQFIAGLLATGLAPLPSWADAGSPAFLSAARRDDGAFVLCGISDAKNVLFQIPLPARGHAAAAHPTRPLAVAFARRPGRFACVVDCSSGQIVAMLDAPLGRHFYGHGAFSQDGEWLYTTENDYGAGAGCLGVWDVAAGFARTDEFASGGIGPHDIKRLPGTDVLVVANGGIDTHPESGRTKLNIPTMRPNLAYIAEGEVIDVAQLDARHHKNSIRHLSVAQDGRVAFGMQWQGAAAASPSLVGVHTRGSAVQLATAAVRQMQGYVGSITFIADGTQIIVTSPRGGLVQSYDAQTLALLNEVKLTDACGAASTSEGVIITTGTGRLVDLISRRKQETHSLQWDNHLVSLG
ncbi:DUF1513 domain-containing protein [Cognatiyoonia sp. IB215446]|uniref:DUF1513 domain-containing protein n=1 Tax=Cognatiyoonia sp. IB215446 TaxID=3097355 RepID=UPI002A148439|nr:DUF1513 domain-containing protein [Cognatiyoonia sp. IB215446]MDX8350606.1 DUF1513 domain-containing protein [Cognatiyoonia sp. IB215446]